MHIYAPLKENNHFSTESGYFLPHMIEIYKKLVNFAWQYFLHFTSFLIKFCSFTHFRMFFLAVVLRFIKIQSIAGNM